MRDGCCSGPTADRRSGHRLGTAWPWRRLDLAIGGLTGWYPYEFLDVDLKGWGSVAVTAVGITLLFLAMLATAHWVDGKLAPAPQDSWIADCLHPAAYLVEASDAGRTGPEPGRGQHSPHDPPRA